MSEWHAAFDSASGGPSSSSHEFGASDDPTEQGLFGAEADEFAFLRDEEALPQSEMKYKDALIFLVDCSALMQFPADLGDLDDGESSHIRVKPEPSSIDTATGHRSHHGASSSHESAAAASSSSPSPAAASASSSAPRRRVTDSSTDGRTQFQMVWGVVLHSIRQKIISNPDDYIGVILFGSRESQNPNSFPHIYIHTPLQNLTANIIRKLDQLMDQDEFDQKIGSLSEKDVNAGKVEMDKILWVASSMFAEAAVGNCTKRILLLTNNDTPFNTNDPMSRMRAVQKGKDLRDLDITTDLIAVGKKPDAAGNPKPFNPLLFFKDILIYAEDESMDSMHATFRTKFSDLKDKLFKKNMKKRALGSVPLQLGAGVNVGVKLYCMLRETRKESAVFLDMETNERLETQTRYLDTSTGAVLKDHEMQRYYPYGGAKVLFSKEELAKLKELGPPGIILMGFKPYDALKVHLNFKNSYFIYPDDTQFTDSSKAFKALLYAMNELKQIAICRLIYRRGSIPRFVALVPQMPKIDPDGEVIQAPGMNLIFLPYADDIRKLRFEPTPIATDALIEDAKKVVAKLTVKSLPHLSNPVLQKHFRVIQAIALEEPPPGDDEIEDALQPDTEGMAKYAPLINKFAADARELGQAALAEVEPPTRRRKADGAGPAKPKKEEPGYDEVDWRQMMDNDTLKKLTIPVLKVYCRHHKLPLSGTKSDLLERVTASLLV